MADRFPSLEEFDSGAQTKAQGEASIELDPTSTTGDDFLTREKAALGDDADQFASSNDIDAFGGDIDLLGGDGGAPVGEEVTEFESSFPEISTQNEGVAPGGSITGTSAPYQSYTNFNETEAEPEVITQWRERRDLALQERIQKSAERKEQTIKTAQQSIDDFYDNYNTKKEKTIAQARQEAEEFLSNREDTSSGGTSWERIAKLVDVSGKGTRGGASGSGKERFRELLLSLKKDEKAPGASGI